MFPLQYQVNFKKKVRRADGGVCAAHFAACIAFLCAFYNNITICNLRLRKKHLKVGCKSGC